MTPSSLGPSTATADTTGVTVVADRPDRAVYAAGGLVWRVFEDKLRILLIHRTKYRDVTLPKGKVDPGEMLAETAVREIFEETGIRVSLGAPVGVSRYTMANRKQKVVHYWAAEATDEAVRASAFVPNREIAALEWVSLKKARARLSYPVDVEILDAFAKLVDDGALRTFPLVVLRHAKAANRGVWLGSDASRPLTPRGHAQSKAIVGPLRAFGIERIVSSDARRCVETVMPLSKAIGHKVRKTELLSQDSWEEGLSDPRTVIGKRVRSGRPAVLCSHGP
ncbi:MAG: DNA mismatch repair protein MutT, partial [Microbacterium sp. 14-71-5]